MGNRVDFEKLRKRRQRAQSIKRIAVLAVLLACVGGIFVLNTVLVDMGVSTRLTDFVDSMGGSGFPVTVPGGIIRDVKSSGKDLVVLNDANLYIYNRKGKIITSLQQMNDSTVMTVTPERVLTFDVGSKHYAIHSRSRELLSKTVDSSLQGAAMNGRGDYALISSSAQYVAKVTVFNKQFEQKFEWLSSENMVMDIALAPKGGRMAALCVNTRAGEAYTLFYLFDFSVEEELARKEIPGEIPLEVQYLDGGGIGVLTDRAYRIFSEEGAELHAYLFEGRVPLGIERQDKNTLLWLSLEEGGQELVLLGERLNPLAEFAPDGRLRDMALSANAVFLLSETGIATYSHAFEARDRLEMRGITDIHYCAGRLYYLNEEEIAVLGG